MQAVLGLEPLESEVLSGLGQRDHDLVDDLAIAQGGGAGGGSTRGTVSPGVDGTSMKAAAHVA